MPLVQYSEETNKQTRIGSADTDQLSYADLFEWFAPTSFRSFSIQYVFERVLYFKVDKKEYTVNNESFMLAGRQPDVQVNFDLEKKVKSICIEIYPGTLAEAFSVLTRQRSIDFQDYLKYPDFYGKKYSFKSSELGKRLIDLFSITHPQFSDQCKFELNKEWYLEIAEIIIFHEIKNYQSLKQLKYAKQDTNKEILRRLNTGKEYMEAHYAHNPKINEIARKSNLSEFLFIRSFKKAFGLTPYQYMLNKRLEYASELIKQTDLKFTEISSLCGFHDIFTFSKAFKRKYGQAPTLYNAKKAVATKIIPDS